MVMSGHAAGMAAPVQSFLFAHSRGQLVYDCRRSCRAAVPRRLG
ncbi:hypothetical protein [Actinomadura rubteroloni]|nr:hypothetical protein [Actinomadura rubteroloni]